MSAARRRGRIRGIRLLRRIVVRVRLRAVEADPEQPPVTMSLLYDVCAALRMLQPSRPPASSSLAVAVPRRRRGCRCPPSSHPRQFRDMHPVSPMSRDALTASQGNGDSNGRRYAAVRVHGLEVERNSNELHVNRDYRMQFNNSIGRCKGGFRFRPSVNQSALKFFGFEPTLRHSFTGLPMGRRQGCCRLRSQELRPARDDEVLPEFHDRAPPPPSTFRPVISASARGRSAACSAGTSG